MKLITILLLYWMLVFLTLQIKLKGIPYDRNYDSELADDIEGVTQSNLLNLKSDKKTNLFSKVSEKIKDSDIVMYAGKMMANNDESIRAFNKLDAMANLENGKEKLKNNGALTAAIKLLLSLDSFKINVRICAAKLQTKLYGVPTSIQMTQTKYGGKFKDISSYVVNPRVSRIYRPDYYIENYKAGNWEP